jgi:hypothetical protein
MKTAEKSVDFTWSFALTQFSCQQGNHMLVVYKKICSANMYITPKRISMQIKGRLFEME